MAGQEVGMFIFLCSAYAPATPRGTGTSIKLCASVHIQQDKERYTNYCITKRIVVTVLDQCN